jgi:DNA ligase-1
MDGEVHALKPDGTIMEFNDTQSAVMTKAGQPDFVFKVFDHFKYAEAIYFDRYEILNERFKDVTLPSYVEKVVQYPVTSLSALKKFGAKCVADGHEGAIYRDPQAQYKEGRSTFLQGILTKWVPYARSEGIIVGFEEMMHNANPAEQDALGHTKRSSHKANMIPTGILGAFIVLTEEWGTFNIGTGPGLDHALRQKIWENQDDYHHKLLNFRYKPYGTKYKPRHPQYMGIRHAFDMGEPV